MNFVSPAVAATYPYQIPYQELASAKSSVRFKIAFCRSPKKFNDVFKGLKAASGNDIKATTLEQAGKLGDFHDRGDDMKYYRKNFLDMIELIDYDQAELDKKECQIAFVLPE